MTSYSIPNTQWAVQLTGPDELRLNTSKPVHKPGPYQILGQVEAVGLCFSDLKLLKQYSKHARKERIGSGIEPAILKEIPSYVPDEMATVPGHETTVRVVAVGKKVKGVRVGARYLVETDYRWLPTTNSNASFGYNFEGGLQQYVLMDQRVITSPEGELFLLPASEKLSASAVALVEPWACVEEAYAVHERTTLRDSGKMLVVSDGPIDSKLFTAFIGRFGKPAQITLVSKEATICIDSMPIVLAGSVTSLPDTAFDDVVYFGANPATAEALFSKLAANGLIVFVQNGKRFGRPVTATVGRVHYGNIRMVGTVGHDPSEAMVIPPTGEIRAGDKIHVIGAAGPMGVMHVIRDLCQGVEKVEVYAADMDDHRLGLLNRIAEPIAGERKIGYHPYNPSRGKPKVAFTYTALMAPVPKLVDGAIGNSAAHAIINIFAGIPASISAPIDLDTYIQKQLYFIGTSGSVLKDMKVVLAKVEMGRLDTDLSVAAITGMAGAVDGIRAVEKALIPGKILVYPACETLPLTPLDQLAKVLPAVAAKLDNGLWNLRAEQALLIHFTKK
jgi:L-sorbose 1-phosphate reductase